MSLICKIIEIKEGKVLVNIENQTVTFLAENFPENIRINDEFHINFWNTKSEIKDKNLAKEVLEEILNGK